MAKRRVGLVVNPVAGMGGKVGLHGTDGAALLEEARRRGATPTAPTRARRALRRLAAHGAIAVLAAPGPMGADLAEETELTVATLAMELGEPTTADDTVQAARRLHDEGVDLLLFVGGDGTALDVVRGAGGAQPILGVPGGVKMRSAVFATGPEAAGDLAAEFLARTSPLVERAEVLDAPPCGADGDRALCSELLALATVPGRGRGLLTGPKAGSALGSRVELEALCARVAAELEPGKLYLFGPGSTTGEVLEQLGLEPTPLGVDAVLDGALVGSDLGEAEILAVMQGSAPVRLVLGVVGGQGMLIGRGNQQLGPRVLERLAPDDVVILSAAEKLLALDPPRLIVDAGDEAPLAWLSGYRRVRVGPSRYLVMKVEVP